MMALIDALTPCAKLSGSLNLVWRDTSDVLLVDMVDGVGFVRGQADAGHPVRDGTAWLVGSGGAGSAIIALCEAGIGHLHFQDAERAGSGAAAPALPSVPVQKFVAPWRRASERSAR